MQQQTFASATPLSQEQFLQILQFQQNFNAQQQQQQMMYQQQQQFLTYAQQQLMQGTALPLPMPPQPPPPPPLPAPPATERQNSHDSDENDDQDDEKFYKLFVGNIDDKVDEEVLYELFLQAGPIDELHWPREPNTNKRRKFAFIRYKHRCTAAYAMHLLVNTALFGRTLTIKYMNSEELPPLPPLEINGQIINANNEIVNSEDAQRVVNQPAAGYIGNPFAVGATANWTMTRGGNRSEPNRNRNRYDDNAAVASNSQRRNKQSKYQRHPHGGSDSRSEQRRQRR